MNNRLKRILVLCLCLLCVTVLLCSVGISASANSNEVTIGSTEFDAAPGKQFTTTIYVDNSAGLNSLNFTIGYDASNLTLVSSANVNASSIERGNYIDVSCNLTSSVKTNLITLTFLVDEEAYVGASNAIWVESTSNGVTIKDEIQDLFIRLKGDVYNNKNDGFVNARDAAYLLQAIAGSVTLSDAEIYYANVYTADDVSGNPILNSRDVSLINQNVSTSTAFETKYTVTFIAGNKVILKSVTAGSTLQNVPAVPEKEYNDGYWSLSETSLVAPNYTINSPLTVYAYYETTQTFNVSYDLNGASGYIAPVSLNAGEALGTAPSMAGVTAVDGYEFVRWVDESGETYDFTSEVVADMVLTARWGSIDPSTADYDFHVDTSDGDNTFKSWLSNANGYDVQPGESLTMQFTINGVNEGFWYNVYGGFSVYSGAVVASAPSLWNHPVSLGFYGNWAYDTVNYSGRPAVLTGDTNLYGDSVISANFDPYTDIYTNEVNTLKLVYTAPSTSAPGSIILYRKAASAASWTQVTSITNITTDRLLDNVHIVWWWESSQHDGSAYGFDLSDVRFSLSSDGYLNQSLMVGDDGRLSSSNPKVVENEITVSLVLDGADLGTVYTGQNLGYYLNDKLPSTDELISNNRYASAFGGWYLDEDYQTPVTEDMKITANTALYGYTYSAYTYEIDGSNATITGLIDGVSITENMEIPSSIDGYTVTEIADSAFEGIEMTSLVLPSTLQVISDEAFRDCLALDTVTFGSGNQLKTIGDSAFRGCTALTNITIPSSVTTVGELALYDTAQTTYNRNYSLNLTNKEYYSPKFTYEFMGEDVMPIGGYIEPSTGYFANGATLQTYMKDFVDSGCNIMINIGQSRYGTSEIDYELMLYYLEQYDGMILMSASSIYPFEYAYTRNAVSLAGSHVTDEPGFTDWTEFGEYSKYHLDAQGNPTIIYPNKTAEHLSWTNQYTRKLYFINLLPINTPVYAIPFGADNYAISENLNNLYNEHLNAGRANIDYYYRTYIENMHPEVFSYDFYPMWNNGGGQNSYLAYPNLNGKHFEQLYKTRYYTQEYSLSYHGHETPFWNFIQLSGLGNNNTGMRSTTLEEVLWQVNTAFIFGSKGYQYHTFSDYGDITGAGADSGYYDTPMNIDGSKNTAVYNKILNVNTQSQAFAKWLLNASVDHIGQYGSNPNNETINSSMFTARDNNMTWSLSSTSGKNNLVSYMKYYANNNQYKEGVAGDVRELYFVCNNATQTTNNGNITLNFNKAVSGSYIYNGVEQKFSGTSLTVNTSAGAGFAVLLDK